MIAMNRKAIEFGQLYRRYETTSGLTNRLSVAILSMLKLLLNFCLQSKLLPEGDYIELISIHSSNVVTVLIRFSPQDCLLDARLIEYTETPRWLRSPGIPTAIFHRDWSKAKVSV